MHKLIGKSEQSKKSEIFRIQRIIAVVAGSIGLLVCLINFIDKLESHGALASFLKQEVIILFITTIFFLLTGFFDHGFFRIIQLLLGVITGALGVLDAYNSIHGIGILILFIIIAFKYGYLERRTRLKIVLLIIGIFGLIEYSARTSEQGGAHWMLGLNSILYLTLFIFVLYLIYSNEINTYISRTNAAESTIVELESERKELFNRLEVLNLKIEDLHRSTEPIDLDAMGITDREKEVIEALILYRETERDLAERLGIKYQTIKVHFKHIRNKLGVDRREEIIDMCRNNF